MEMAQLQKVIEVENELSRLLELEEQGAAERLQITRRQCEQRLSQAKQQLARADDQALDNIRATAAREAAQIHAATDELITFLENLPAETIRRIALQHLPAILPEKGPAYGDCHDCQDVQS